MRSSLPFTIALSLSTLLLLGSSACVGEPPTNGNDAGGGGDSGTNQSSPPPDSGTDASQDDGGTTADAGDAAVDAGPACNPISGAFGAPIAVGSLNSNDLEYGAWLAPDGLSVYFTRGNGTTGDTYVATRAKPTDPFGTPTALAAPVNDPATGDLYPTEDPTELTLFFDSYRGGNGHTHIYMTTRGSKQVAYTAAPTEVTATDVAGASDIETPYVIPGAMYFAAFVPANKVEFDLYRAPIVSGNIGTPVAITSANSAIKDERPVVTPDERFMYMRRYKKVNTTYDFEIFFTHRAKAQDPWTTPVSISLNTNKNEEPAWISPDGCVLYYASDSGGNQDLYLAVRGK